MAAAKERLHDLMERRHQTQARRPLRLVEVLMSPPEPPEPGDLEAIEAGRREAREGKVKPIEQVLRESGRERTPTGDDVPTHGEAVRAGRRGAGGARSEPEEWHRQIVQGRTSQRRREVDL